MKEVYDRISKRIGTIKRVYTKENGLSNEEIIKRMTDFSLEIIGCVDLDILTPDECSELSDMLYGD